MTVIQTLAEVAANDEVISNHFVLTCLAPTIANSARPGQFLNVLASGTYESILRKPFSVFRAEPETGLISMLYQVIGPTTLGMARKAPGDTIDLVGPLGGKVFQVDKRPDPVHVMVGGGYGVPPLVFLASRIKAANPDARIVFIVGARRRDLLLCELDLAHLKIAYHPATEDGSHGVHGRVTDVLKDHLGPESSVYCCGPTPMMRAVGELCIEASVPCQVSVEVPMPCGVGVCMGCVLDLADGRRVRSCTDGPVFAASEVLWK